MHPARYPVCGRSWRLAGAALLVLVSGAVAAEPSEQEMRAALEARYAAVNAGMQATTERCNSREYQRGQGDPVLAMQCLQLAIGGGVSRDGQSVRAPSARLSSFEKIACEKAQGRPGFVCDYIAAMDMQVHNLPPSLRGLMGSPQVTQARFVKRGNGWIVLD